MTDTLTRPETSAPIDTTSSRSARWRVAARLAQRQVRRTWPSSLLVVALVALPIAAMAAASVYVDSSLPTTEEEVRLELGQTEAWVQGGGVPDAGFFQAPTSPYWTGYVAPDGSGSAGTGGDIHNPPEGGVVTEDPTQALPAGTEVIPISYGRERIETAAGIVVAQAAAGDAANPTFEGRFELVSGRAPANADEVLVTAALLDKLGGTVGSEVRLVDGGEVFRISGVVDMRELGRNDDGIILPDASRYPEQRYWYLPDDPLSWDDVQALNAEGVVAYSREVVLDPPAWTDPWGNGESDYRTGTIWGLVVGLAVGAAFAAYVVIMLAGAAFAVSARRQQRALAIAASVGADARDVRRTVVLQGTVLGAVGGVVGIAAGIGIAAITMPMITPGSARAPWGLHIPWAVLIGVLVFAVIVGTASSLVPARSLAKSDVIASLRGARKPQKVRVSRPIWGSLMILVGIGVVVLSGIAAGAVAVNTEIPWDSALRWLPVVGIVAGPVIAQLGIVVSGRWLLWLASIVLGRISLSAKIASRDAVANASRTVPAFAAIAATVFIAMFAVALGSMVTGQSARTWTYSAPIGTVLVTWYAEDGMPLTGDASEDAAAASRAMLQELGADNAAEIARQPSVWSYGEAADVPADAATAVAVVPDDALADRNEGWGYGGGELADRSNNISVISETELPVLLGREPTDAERAAFRDGAALVGDPVLLAQGEITIAAWAAQDVFEGKAPDNIFKPEAGVDLADPLWSEQIPAVAVDTPPGSVGILISPQRADDLDLTVTVDRLYATLPAGKDVSTERLYGAAQSASSPEYTLSAWKEQGPQPATWIFPLLGVTGVLVIGASAVALGLARFERRPDDATLSAVGASKGMRRRIAFWQGFVIAGFGTVSGAAAGVLPAIGFWLQSQTDTRGPLELSDVPWWLVLAFSIGLPLVIAAINALIPPRRADLTRRTAIA